MDKNRFQNLRSLWGLFIFGGSLWVLHGLLKDYPPSAILSALTELHWRQIFFAVALTFINYWTLGGYEILGFQSIRRSVPYSKVVFAAFVSDALSNNIGSSSIFGTSSRFHLYSALELSGEEIFKLAIFSGLTFLLGILGVSGVLFLLEPRNIPAFLHLPIASVQPAGIFFLGLLAIYLTASLIRKNFLAAFSRVAVSFFDWILAGSVLFVLLPDFPGANYPVFLSVFILAEIAKVISQVPGGLGVFEAVILVFLAREFPAPKVLAALLTYRAVYYLLPLAVATGFLAVQEIFGERKGVKKISALAGQWLPFLLPRLVAFNALVAGAILLFSGALPPVSERLAWLKDFFPLSVIEISHFLGSLTGLGLLFLARGLQRRLDGAYFLTALLLGAGILFSLLKGVDYEEAILLSIMLAALMPARRYFYRKTSLTAESFTPLWTTALLVVVISSIWLGLFSHKYVQYSDDLWWRFAFFDDAPRFLRASVGVIVAALFFAGAKLLKPAASKPVLPDSQELEEVRKIVKISPRVFARLALVGDKAILFSESKNSFLMYGVHGRSWVALGGPVGLEEERSELVWRFREMVDCHDAQTVFSEIGKENLPLYLDLGLSLLKIGEEAKVSLEGFTLEGGERRDLRQSHRHLEREGCVFEMIPAGQADSFLGELKKISDEWLVERKTKEKGFSLGFFKEDYLKECPMALVKREGEIIAFANVLEGAGKEELSLDLMRYLKKAPSGIMDYLFIEVMLWGSREGYRWFNLGVAPLAGFERRALAPFWNRLGSLIFRFGEHFYNFQGLRHFKDKFDPVWEPKYIASPGGWTLPGVLMDIATLNSGGFRGIFTK